ncbi:hypothetical protein HDU81_009379, partial [Chytriomyces hyalinus]
ELVQQVVDIVKPTKIQQVALALPKDWQNVLRSDLKDLVAAMFLQHGWHERPKHVVTKQFGDYVVYRRPE